MMYQFWHNDVQECWKLKIEIPYSELSCDAAQINPRETFGGHGSLRNMLLALADLVQAIEDGVKTSPESPVG